MAGRKIVWTSIAKKQLRFVLQYWLEKNKSTSFSLKLLQKIDHTTKILSDHPSIGRKTEFEDVRIAALKNYSLIYTVLDTEIVVLAFWDNRQNPEMLHEMISSKRK